MTKSGYPVAAEGRRRVFAVNHLVFTPTPYLGGYLGVWGEDPTRPIVVER